MTGKFDSSVLLLLYSFNDLNDTTAIVHTNLFKADCESKFFSIN